STTSRGMRLLTASTVRRRRGKEGKGCVLGQSWRLLGRVRGVACGGVRRMSQYPHPVRARKRQIVPGPRAGARLFRRKRAVEAAGGTQQDPGEEAGGRGRDPEKEKPQRVAEFPCHRQAGEGEVAQDQRVDEGEEHHRRHAGREEAGPGDGPHALGQRTWGVVKAWLAEVG